MIIIIFDYGHHYHHHHYYHSRCYHYYFSTVCDVRQINMPPTPGTCSVSPYERTISTGKDWTITVDGWFDEDQQIEEYQFFSKRCAGGFHLSLPLSFSRPFTRFLRPFVVPSAFSFLSIYHISVSFSCSLILWVIQRFPWDHLFKGLGKSHNYLLYLFSSLSCLAAVSSLLLMSLRGCRVNSMYSTFISLWLHDK